MKFLICLIFMLISSKSEALEAVVTVLETPMFKYRSYEAPVVQYLRKGDVIKIHPSIANDREIEKYAPSPDKRESLQKKLKQSAEYSQDPLFRGENENTAYLEDEFIPTLDRQGNTVYILSEHIFVYFNDNREFDQKISKRDPTDYRLEEPLPTFYPLKTPSGYRGQFLIGLTQPFFESYNYRESIKTKGYTTPIDLNMTMLKQAPGKYQERLFIGGSLNLRTFSNTYSFQGGRLSKEEWTRLGIGPTISFDAFKGEKNRINLSSTITVNLLDRLDISQSQGEIEDARIYNGYSIVPRLALQYHRKQILEDLDFVLGTSMEMAAATSFHAKNAGRQTTWWRNLGNDKFTSRTTFSLGGYVGIQSAY